MNYLANDIPMEELIARLDAHMVEKGYTANTMRHFRQAWNALNKLTVKKGTTHFTKEIGFELLKDHYHIDPYDLKLSSYKQVKRRAVMLLLEFQISGTIAKHMLLYDHTFPDAYKEIGDAYIVYLNTERHLRAGTIRNHSIRLLKAFQFFESHGFHSITDVTEECVAAYIMTFAGMSRTYISSAVRILKSFFDYARANGTVTSTMVFPIVTVYKDRKIPEYYMSDEVTSILNAVDRSNPSGKRNYAIILLAARCGLRISDIINLKLSDIDFNKNTISIIQKKPGKPLNLDLLPDVGWAIIDYLKYGRPDVESKYVFLCHTHPYREFATGSNLEYIIRRYANSVGITKEHKKKAGFHMLRYSLASDLLQKNVSLTTISGILGHSELNVTTRYTQLDLQRLKECALEVPV